jgi:thiol:disulfide interchange protein DsbC
MLKKLLQISLLGFSLIGTINYSYASDGVIVESDLSVKIQSNLTKYLPDLKVDQIRTTPLAGIYEIDSGRKVFYSDVSGSYIMLGNLLNLANKTSLTKQRSEELNIINWQQLPLDLAIMRKIGKGNQKIAVFTDPDCPFCQRLEAETMNKLRNVTIYYYFYPLPIHPQAADDAKRILCAENPESAMVSFMAKGKTLGKNNNCRRSNDLALMQKIGKEVVQVSGTPTIVLPNGRIVSGLVPADYLTNLISQNSIESTANNTQVSQ